jgi:DNA-binding transcriptional ArsR family regulator
MTTDALHMIPMPRLEAAAATLRLLAHPHRLALCERMLAMPQSVGALATALGLRHNVVSQHLNILRAYGIVAARRQGRSVVYRVVHPGPGWLLECIRRHMPESSGLMTGLKPRTDDVRAAEVHP